LIDPPVASSSTVPLVPADSVELATKVIPPVLRSVTRTPTPPRSHSAVGTLSLSDNCPVAANGPSVVTAFDVLVNVAAPPVV